MQWDRVALAVGVILACMLLTEGFWARSRRLRTAEQERQWVDTQRSIRRTLNDPARTISLADIKARAVANQAQLDQVCESTANALSAPAAVITVVEHQGQRWLAYYGADWCDEDTRSGLLQPLETSYCKYVVTTDATLVITDALKDIRVRSDDGQTREMVRAYLGAPVHTTDGVVVGSLCVFDNRPRKWSTRDQATVESFASLVRL